MIEKYYNEEGKVGVIYSPDYGAGFSTWHEDKNICFDKNIIQMILNKNYEDIKEYCKKNGIYYMDGVLKVEWLEPGTIFEITEYDGSEFVKLIDYPDSLLTA